MRNTIIKLQRFYYLKRLSRLLFVQKIFFENEVTKNANPVRKNVYLTLQPHVFQAYDHLLYIHLIF